MSKIVNADKFRKIWNFCKNLKSGKTWKSVNDRTSDPNGREKHVIAKSGDRSTFEKEAYAIFYTINKFDFLLRDVRFVVETDHKNLTFLKTDQSAKVRRWQLALQEFNFKYIHIKGEDKIVADALLGSVTTIQRMVAKTEMLAAFLISGDSIGSNAPTFEPRSNSNSGRPVKREPSIDPKLRTK